MDQVTNPILPNLVSSYEHFYSEFSKKDGNYKEAYLFCNTAFIREANSVNLLDKEFFGFNSRRSLPLSKLKYCDCFTNEHLKNLNQFLQMGIVLTPATWFRLQSALRLARNRLRKNDESKNFLENISNFLSRIKKGSKKFRLIMECNTNRLSDPRTLRTVNSFSDLAACPVPVLEK